MNNPAITNLVISLGGMQGESEVVLDRSITDDQSPESFP
jgi:hypothetical protein